MLGFFRRRPIFQAQTTNGGFGQAGAAGAPGATGPAGPAGATGPSGLGPTQTENPDSATLNALFVTPIDVVDAVPGETIIPLMYWSEINASIQGTNSPALEVTVPFIGDVMSNSSLWSTQRNTGIRDVPNLASENSAFGTALPSTGAPVELTLSIAPTGAPTVAGRVFLFYFSVPALIP